MPHHRLKSRPVTSLAGKLIVFEGADGAGKTSLIRAVFDSLREAGKVERWPFHLVRPGAGDPEVEAEHTRLAAQERGAVRMTRIVTSRGVEATRDAAIAALVSRSAQPTCLVKEPEP